MKAKETLETALELVTGDRAEQHGDMHEVHELAAALWTAYTGHAFTPKDVAILLSFLKAAREKCTPGNPDNLIDYCGYGAVAAELAERPSKQYFVADEIESRWAQGGRNFVYVNGKT